MLFKHPLLKAPVRFPFHTPVYAPKKQGPNSESNSKGRKWIFRTQCAPKGEGGNKTSGDEVNEGFHTVSDNKNTK